MTTDEAAVSLGWDVSTVRKWCGLMAFPKHGRDYWIDDYGLEKLAGKKDRRYRAEAKRRKEARDGRKKRREAGRIRDSR